MNRILVVFGTRPEAIKMAPVVKTLQQFTDKAECLVCVTGQHREMLDQVLHIFDIQPHYNFDVMRTNQGLSQLTTRMLIEMDALLSNVPCDCMLVQGDTTTVMAAAIAAFHRSVPVGHVEAGLRTYDRENPFPEEMNRVIADHISQFHFAPTEKARQNLLAEGISSKNIFVTGNTGIDALHWIVKAPLGGQARNLLQTCGLEPDDVSKDKKRLILVTAHRRENFGQPIRDICQALKNLANRKDVVIIYPVHLNPNIWLPVNDLLADVEGICLTPPLEYDTLIHLMKHSHLILTDSGGIQEEAPSLGVPVLVLRKTTERPEVIATGCGKLVGTDSDDICSQAEILLDDPTAWAAMGRVRNLYGDGQAAMRIVDVLLSGRCQEFKPDTETMLSQPDAQVASDSQIYTFS